MSHPDVFFPLITTSNCTNRNIVIVMLYIVWEPLSLFQRTSSKVSDGPPLTPYTPFFCQGIKHPGSRYSFTSRGKKDKILKVLSLSSRNFVQFQEDSFLWPVDVSSIGVYDRDSLPYEGCQGLYPNHERPVYQNWRISCLRFGVDRRFTTKADLALQS